MFPDKLQDEITHKKTVEDTVFITAIPSTEELLHVLADTAPVMIWMTGCEPYCNFFNSHWLEFTGRSHFQEVGNGWLEGVHPEDRQQCQEKYNYAFQKHQKFQRQYRLCRGDGEYRWILDTAAPRFTDDGCFLGYIGYAVDFTDTKIKNLSLQESETRLRLALDAAEIGVWDWNLITKQVSCSGQVEHILGWTSNYSPTTYKAFLKFVYKSDRSIVTQAIRSALHFKTNYDADFRIVWQDGSIRWVRSKGDVLRDHNGQAIQMMGTLIDITDRKLAELALGEALQATQVQLIQNEKMSSLGQLVAGIAHEINNPVNFIHGNITHVSSYAQDLLHLVELYQQHHSEPVPEIQEEIEAIDLEFLCEDLPKILASMKIGTDRIRQIVLSLRNFSRLDEADMKVVDIHEGIDNTLLLLQNRLKAKPEHQEIQIVKEYSKLPMIDCYPGQLNQVFMNLLANAIDALEEELEIRDQKLGEDFSKYPVPRVETPSYPIPIIRIRTEIKDKFVLIRIADNGPGMTEEVRQKLFDPFFTTKPAGKGTGMGLSISYKIIVEKHGGQLECISAPGKGAEFVVTIPLQQLESSNSYTDLLVNSL